MNKTRRKILEGIIEVLQEQKTAIESVCEEEQEAYDNLPENIQETDKGETMQGCIDMMQEVVDACDETSDFEDSLIEMCETCGVDL